MPARVWACTTGDVCHIRWTCPECTAAESIPIPPPRGQRPDSCRYCGYRLGQGVVTAIDELIRALSTCQTADVMVDLVTMTAPPGRGEP